MNRGKITFISIILLIIIGCAGPRYTLVEPKRVEIAGAYSVEPQIAWNARPLNRKESFYWTVNGYNLDRLMFFNNIKDGEKLFPSFAGSRMTSPYRKGMKPLEIAELLADTTRVMGWENLQILDMRLHNFGPYEGFRIEMRMLGNKLSYKNLTSGAVIDGELFLIDYLAVEMKYYPKYLEQVKKLLDSIEKI
jgi:hypothetical protein